MQGNHLHQVVSKGRAKIRSKETPADFRHASEGSRKIRDANIHPDENLMRNQPYMEDIILKTLAG